eukprot:scaffold1680_cov391-Prasinococcus_capsulatus_cf.AAC.6
MGLGTWSDLKHPPTPRPPAAPASTLTAKALCGGTLTETLLGEIEPESLPNGWTPQDISARNVIPNLERVRGTIPQAFLSMKAWATCGLAHKLTGRVRVIQLEAYTIKYRVQSYSGLVNSTATVVVPIIEESARMVVPSHCCEAGETSPDWETISCCLSGSTLDDFLRAHHGVQW